MRAPAQDADRLRELGEELFASTALSSGRATSCTTCHDPKKAFADGRIEAEGEMKIGIGRNSPTLYGLGAITKFRDPRQAQDAKPGRTPRVLTLEERCLAPLENELEMDRAPTWPSRRSGSSPTSRSASTRSSVARTV